MILSRIQDFNDKECNLNKKMVLDTNLGMGPLCGREAEEVKLEHDPGC